MKTGPRISASASASVRVARHVALKAALNAARCPAAALGLGVLALLGGCAGGLSGLSGTTRFQCSAPSGIPCMSVSGVHARQSTALLPMAAAAPVASLALTKHRTTSWESIDSVPDPSRARASTAPPKPYRADGSVVAPAHATSMGDAALAALRTAPTLIRVWIAPWEDSEGDLNDPGWIYMQLDAGRWLLQPGRALVSRHPTVGTPQVLHAPAAAADGRTVPLSSGSAASPVRSASPVRNPVTEGQGLADPPPAGASQP